MAVVTTTFTSAGGEVWASPTWSANDPSKKLHDELVAWVNAINDPTKIELIHSPGDATARTASDAVRWLLRARESETSSDYGLVFAARLAGTAGNVTQACGCYYNRTAGSANNGAGTYSTISGNFTGLALDTTSTTHFTAYDASGTTPWFIYSAKRVSSNLMTMHYLQRLSLANMIPGSYYPANGLGKWIYATFEPVSMTDQAPYIYTPQESGSAPYKGVNVNGTEMRYPRPDPSRGTGYFFRLGAQYGDTHFLGEPSYDILISNASTGLFLDTTTIGGVTYRRVGPHGFWVRTS